MKQIINHFISLKNIKNCKVFTLKRFSSINTTIITVFAWTRVPIPEYGDDDEEYGRDEYLEQRGQPVPLLEHRALPQHGGELLAKAHAYGGCCSGSSAWPKWQKYRLVNLATRSPSTHVP